MTQQFLKAIQQHDEWKILSQKLSLLKQGLRMQRQKTQQVKHQLQDKIKGCRRIQSQIIRKNQLNQSLKDQIQIIMQEIVEVQNKKQVILGLDRNLLISQLMYRVIMIVQDRGLKVYKLNRTDICYFYDSKPCILIVHYFCELVELHLPWHCVEVQHLGQLLLAKFHSRQLRNSNQIFLIDVPLSSPIIQSKQRLVLHKLIHLNLSHRKNLNELIKGYLISTLLYLASNYLLIVVVSSIHDSLCQYFFIDLPCFFFIQIVECQLQISRWRRWSFFLVWHRLLFYQIMLLWAFHSLNITIILTIHFLGQIQISANVILLKMQKHCQSDKHTNIKTQDDNNKLVNSMIENVIGLKRCQNCHKLIDPMKLSLHYMMCSTAYLRRSQCSFMQPKPLKKCMFCMQQFCQQQFDYHTKLGCKHRLVPCIDCDDMFPLSLFTQHLQVCRAKQQPKQSKQQKQKQEKQQSTFFNSLMEGITTLGVALYDKGSEAATYCSQKIQQNTPTAKLYYEQIKARISDKFEDLFVSLAYDENVEGMPRGQIRKIEITSFQNLSKGEVCTICFCDLVELEPVKKLRCKHIYHPTCIDKWLRINRTCPLCKMDQMQP